MREIKIANSNQQRGAVLIVALIMLLLLTLVGIAGIRDSQMQEKMAGSAEDRALAFQAAESALREGEGLILDGDCTSSCATAGYYGELVASPSRDDNGAQSGGTAVSEADFWARHFSANGADASYWADISKVKVYTGTALPNVLTQPHYVIEKLPELYSALPYTKNAGNVITDPCISEIKDYLITARGTGRSDASVVILQSLYRYSSPPTPPCP